VQRRHSPDRETPQPRPNTGTRTLTDTHAGAVGTANISSGSYAELAGVLHEALPGHRHGRFRANSCAPVSIRARHARFGILRGIER
jgi:hypothetical protein